MDEQKPKPIGRPTAVKTEAEKLAQAAKDTIRSRLSKRKSREAIRKEELEAGIVKKRGRPPKHKGGGDASPDGPC